MDCPYLADDGLCKGLYSGFGCIGERCQASRVNDCQFLVDSCYCTRFARFGCSGPTHCSSLDDYRTYFKQERVQTVV